jgi:hypothetical protein
MEGRVAWLAGAAGGRLFRRGEATRELSPGERLVYPLLHKKFGI